jgi:hypothetical protein
MSLVLTSAYSYQAPLRSKIIFKSNDGTDTYFTHDGFAPDPSTINVFYSDVERAAGESGSFNVVVEDSGNIINKDHLKNTKVYILLGKEQTGYKYFFVGKGRIFSIRRPRSYYQEYLISGPSTKIRAAELMLLWRKSTDKVNNPDYGIGQLVIDSLTDRKPRPLNREAVDDITDWNVGYSDDEDQGGIAPELNVINLPIVNEVFTTYWDWLDRNAALTGAPWDLDYNETTGEEVLTMSYPSSRHSGITIKSGDLKAANDRADKTAYIFDEFNIEDNSTSDVGVATRLYTTTIIDREVISSSNHDHGSTALVSRALAQQLIIENDQRRITSLGFIMSKVGEPESPKDRVNGDICLDFGDNTPRGKTIATFQIPLSDIKSTPDTIFVDDIDVKIRFLQGNNKIWIRLFQRSGLDGDPNTDAANAVRWHHSGTFAIAQLTYSANSTNNGGDYKLRDTMTWATSNMGPTYAYNVFSNIRRLQARTNATAAKVLDVIESFYDTSHLSDFRSVNAQLGLALARRSKSRRTVPLRVTIPNNFLYKPYQLVDFNDGLSNEFQTLQVARARYVMSALPGDNPLGAMWSEITLQGEINPIIGSCSCL